MGKPDGGQAFPVTHTLPGYVDGELKPGFHGKEGMSLRDYIASKAMQGMMSDPNWGSPERSPYIEALARQAYMVADAMIAEREK